MSDFENREFRKKQLKQNMIDTGEDKGYEERHVKKSSSGGAAVEYNKKGFCFSF